MTLDTAIQDARKAINRDLIAARLGDNGSGNPYDLTQPGNYWVQKVEADGNLSQPLSMPLYPNANIPPKSGLAVYIGYDEFGTQCIWRASRNGLLAAQISPLVLNPLDTTVYGKVSSTNLATFFCQRHGDTTNFPLSVVVFPGWLEINDVIYFFPGGSVDLTALVPTSGLHCYAVVFIKTDMTLEAFASTPVALTQPLTANDINEAIAARSTGSLIVWAWELSNAQTILAADPTKNVDLRQWLNIPSSGTGGVTAVTASPPLASSGGATPDISLGDITTKLIFDEWAESGTPSADTQWLYAADDNGYTVQRLIDSGAVVFQQGRDVYVIGRNGSGGTVAAGIAVGFYTGSSGIPTFVQADANAPVFFDGVTVDSSADTAYARIQIAGVIATDTTGYSAGVSLYLSTTAGALTATPPTYPCRLQQCGVTLDSTASGHILLAPHLYPEYIWANTVNIGISDTNPAKIIGYTNSKTGTLQWDSTLSANRTWHLPDADGTLALTSDIANSNIPAFAFAWFIG